LSLHAPHFRRIAMSVQADLLLDWYDRHRRVLPWRAQAGARPDPYHVWLSEIMLQQTTVAAVAPYFRAFLHRWPRIADLAAAPRDDVLHAWQGLGYYARARNLHACAQAVAADHGGCFPDNAAALRRLPGIGAYTGAAIAAIAFGEQVLALEANGERVFARLFGIETPLPAAKPEIAAAAEGLVPAGRPGDFAQAVMDLGATVCTVRRPSCPRCPWRDACAAAARGIAESLPRKAPKRDKPLRRGVAFWLRRGDGAVLLRRRPDKGLLGGMMEVPSTPWREAPWPTAEALSHAPLPASWQPRLGLVRHGFTHFDLELAVLAARVANDGAAAAGEWAPLDRLGDHALPTCMRKVVAHALDEGLPLAAPIG
jgi:A/G-specific adenine glycosylase